jgi:hypothetical protein
VYACQAVLHAADASSVRAAAMLLQSLTPPVAALKPLELAMQASTLQSCTNAMAYIDRQAKCTATLLKCPPAAVPIILRDAVLCAE